MNKYLVLFDNCVTNDLLVHVIYAENYEECWKTAYPISQKIGYSEGNFEVFESADQRMAREIMVEMESKMEVAYYVDEEM